MSLSFNCQTCGKSYAMPDNLAGKRARCKACGAEFRVPGPAAAVATAAAPSFDPYGFDETPSRARPLPEADDELAPPPRTFPKETKAKTRSSSRPSHGERNEGLFAWGVRFLVFGAGIFLLPLLGLQWKLVNLMGPGAQMGLGLLCLGVGALCLLASGSGALSAVVGFGVLGAGLLLFLVVLGLRSAPTPPPNQIAGPPPPRGVPPVPRPHFMPRPTPTPPFPSTPSELANNTPPATPGFPQAPAPTPAAPGFPPPPSYTPPSPPRPHIPPVPRPRFPRAHF